MLFEADQLQIRKTFYEAWDRYKQSLPLEPLQQQIVNTILEHPEYFPVMENPVVYCEKEFTADAGECNPFLHFGLHMAVQDQIQWDQPHGIKKIFQELCTRFSPHEATHEIMRELAYQLADMQREKRHFDVKAYMRELRNL